MTAPAVIGIPEAQWSDRQRLLYETMSDISEDCYSAGWLTGLEHALWDAMQSGDLRFGLGEIESESLELCRKLSVELDGWIIWAGDDDVPGMPADQWGPLFVPLSHWKPLADAFHTLHNSSSQPSTT